MIIKKIKELARKNRKKISKEAIKEINKILIEKASDIVRKASRNSDFFGRKTIKKEDIC